MYHNGVVLCVKMDNKEFHSNTKVLVGNIGHARLGIHIGVLLVLVAELARWLP